MSQVTINDRLSKTLREFLIPEFQENFYLISNFPMLRYLGMEHEEADAGDGGGTIVRPRVETIEHVDSGYKFQIPHDHTPFGGGTYAQPIGAQLRPGKFQGDQSNNTVKFITQSMQIPTQVMQAARRPELSVVNEVVQNMMGAAHSMHWEINRMLWAPTGHDLCKINGAVSNSTSITVQTDGTAGDTPATQHLQAGDVLMVGTTNQIQTGTAVQVTVSSVTGDTTFTATQNVTVNDLDLVVRADAYDVSGAAYTELTPLASLVNNTGTVQGINKANNQWFQSKVIGSQGALTLTALNSLAIPTRRFSKNPDARFFVGDNIQWQRYSTLLTTQKYYDASKFEGELAGGLEGLTVFTPDGSLPFFIDDMIEDGKIYLIDPNGYKFFEFRKFGPAEDALGIEGYPAQRIPGTLNYEFALWFGGEIGQVNARSSGVISGITTTNGI